MPSHWPLPASQLQFDTIISISIDITGFSPPPLRQPMKTLRHAEPRQIRHYCFRHYAITPGHDAVHCRPFSFIFIATAITLADITPRFHFRQPTD
jgi:hypothetical protein